MLPKERQAAEAGFAFGKRLMSFCAHGGTSIPDYVKDAVLKGLHASGIDLQLGVNGFEFVVTPKPVKKSYDELVAELEELKKQRNGGSNEPSNSRHDSMSDM